MRTLQSMTGRACAIAAISGAMLMTASPAQADIRVDRSFGGMAQQQGATSAPAGLPPSLFNSSRKPVQTATKPSIPDAADNDQHGAYSVETTIPTLYSKNFVYVTPFPLPPHVNARVTINSVSWKYSTQTQPNSFEAALCWKDAKTCVNISRYASGQSMDFNGKDAMQPFLMQFQVAGTGVLSPPVVGGEAQIIVNYRIWPQ